MEIKIKNLHLQVERLNHLLQDYEENTLQYYNTLSSVCFNWQDQHEKKFESQYLLEKEKINQALEEMSQVQKACLYIVNAYQEFGNYLRIELSKKEQILKEIMMWEQEVEAVLTLYQQLEVEYSSMLPGLKKQQTRIQNIKQKIQDLYERMQKIFLKILENEKEIYHQLSKISVAPLKVDDLKEFI